MLAAGARGYLIKTVSIEEMTKAIRTVYRGSTYLCQEAANAMAHSLPERSSSDRANGGLALREIEVLTLLARGKTSQQIGETLHIATGTVDVHRRNIMRKFELHSVPELTQYAIRKGLLSI